MLNKIISGGQTGVDRAALDVAKIYNIPTGGWCPLGRLAEDGQIPTHYPLKETESKEYAVRTKQNIIDSDGTLILVEQLPINENDGTLLTFEFSKKINKPYFVVDLKQNQQETLLNLKQWLNTNNIKVLNVAGPRASQYPNIYQKSVQYISAFFNSLKQI